MKASLYDYRTLVDKRPTHHAFEIPADLEARFLLFRRNDWVIGLFRKAGQEAPAFAVGVFDMMTDIVLTSVDVAGEADIQAGIAAVCAVDPPVLDAALRAGLLPAPDATLPDEPDTTEDA